MTYLGIDYGQKRIGLAKATDDPAIATPLYTIPNNAEVFSYLEKIVVAEQIDKIVVGVPVSFDGKEYAQAKETRMFGEQLQQKLLDIGCLVNFQNEVLTTKQAERDEVGDSNASAAALILQSFLDREL